MGKVIWLFIGLLVGLGGGWLWGSYASTSQTVSNDPNSGRFLGLPETTWLEDGRDMKLLKDFVFIDSRGRSWVAEKNTVVNGASIPKILWSATGGPLTGKFRNASIVHDAECDRMTAPSTDVHRMFYDACRAGGVGEQEAKRLYWAVSNFGPTWRMEIVNTVASTNPIGEAALKDRLPMFVARKEQVREPTKEELKWAESYFAKENPPLDQVPLLKPPGDEGFNSDNRSTPGV